MRIIGIDFTSAPDHRKPITCTSCTLTGDRLKVDGHERIADFAGFATVLTRPGPWVAGLDFPFSFSRGFLAAMGWPLDWQLLVDRLTSMKKPDYKAAVRAFRDCQPEGQKHLKRTVDGLTGGAAPNNVVNPPVGLMLFEGVQRLRAAGLCLPGLADGDSSRIAVEAYPAVAARALIGTTAYKDGKPADHTARLALRRQLIARLAAGAHCGITVSAPVDLAEDPGGDDIDALLCAVQAAWAQRSGLTASEGPVGRFDPAEGWIADPNAFDPPLDVPFSAV